MTPVYIFTVRGTHVLEVARRLPDGRIADVRTDVLTTAQACRRLGKSRRQVYRYLKTGRLVPCGCLLGQWLFAREALEGVARTELPRRLRRFFWDAALSSLSADRHTDFILARLLEFGDRRALGWVFRTYPASRVTEFLQGRGRELLNRRTWRFWAAQLGLTRTGSRKASWRARGRRWGGVR